MFISVLPGLNNRASRCGGRAKHLSQKSDVRMWREAGKLAASGDFEGWQAIERELRSKGFVRANLLLDNNRVRDKLDDLCKSAQEKRADADRA
ncbi:hypothetical protein CK222_10590 [Mesorhizobium sp. WSM3866]|uniref:hypothetical protein n=1 Tax=Mesorhizobium sp. WSM3866 TaxID=422271 RepID=UPI000BAF9C81|nr:hypothetical protein [Mesorhizobium sp. WSM3866]PBB43242.1 hypothetical protein CK222_10590 [Mesorhizobium sp. WSM3866]